MDNLVKRMKSYYSNNPHFLFQSETGVSLICNITELKKISLWPENEGISLTSKIKPLPPSVNKKGIELSELKLGFSLPPLLKELYMEVGNGGFGPEIMGLDGGWTAGLNGGGTAIDIYLYYKNISTNYNLSEIWSRLHKSLLPLRYGGCFDYYLLDCRISNGQIFRWDSTGLGSDQGWEIAAPSLRDWLDHWLVINENEVFDEVEPQELPFRF